MTTKHKHFKEPKPLHRYVSFNSICEVEGQPHVGADRDGVLEGHRPAVRRAAAIMSSSNELDDYYQMI